MAALAAGWVGAACAGPAALALDGRRLDDGARLQLSWRAQKVVPPALARRSLSSGAGWAEIAPEGGLAQVVVTDAPPQGRAWEYRITLTPADGTPAQEGYWVAATALAAAPVEGRAWLVVDETLAAPLADRLARLADDLTGAGWEVTRIDTPRGVTDAQANLELAFALRTRLNDGMQADPMARHAVLLVGHVPVVLSGWVAPDGHEPRAAATDLFYATPGAEWPLTHNPKGGLQLAPQIVPGDVIRASVGRVDFAAMGPRFDDEITLTARWLDRNHRFRHAQTPVPARAYGASGSLMVERAALGNIVGPAQVIEAGHHGHAGQGPFLLGVDFGNWDGASYGERPRAEAVFTINFGSGKLFFDTPANAMRALLASSETALTAAWGGRPAWQLHGLAVNETIGEAQMRTVNNGRASRGGMASRDYQATGNYDWINPIWVNLMGDPTLRPFVLAPVTDPTAQADGDGTRLGWVLPKGADRVVIYHADDRDGPYRVLAEDVTGDSYRAAGKGWFMIRAKGLAQLYAGSVWLLSQGAVVAAP